MFGLSKAYAPCSQAKLTHKINYHTIQLHMPQWWKRIWRQGGHVIGSCHWSLKTGSGMSRLALFFFSINPKEVGMSCNLSSALRPFSLMVWKAKASG